MPSYLSQTTSGEVILEGVDITKESSKKLTNSTIVLEHGKFAREIVNKD